MFFFFVGIAKNAQETWRAPSTYKVGPIAKLTYLPCLPSGKQP